MFDTHNAVDEGGTACGAGGSLFRSDPARAHQRMDGRHPGTGDYNFKPVFEVLRRRGYRHWVSLEAFDFTPGAEKIATIPCATSKKQVEQLAA